jgi:hypothetical protein
MRLLLILSCVVAFTGCSRVAKLTEPERTEAGPGNYCQVGPLGMAVESVRLGKIRMRGMMGQDCESDRDVFTIKTRFKLMDTATPVKQPPLQRDGTMMGSGGLVLKDENGQTFKQVGGFGFNAVSARRTADAILTANDPETTDLITFESVLGASGDLILEAPTNYQIQQPDGKFLFTPDSKVFRFRIPRAMWATPPAATEAGPGNWSTVGPVSVAVESVRLGRVKMRGIGINREGESQDPIFAVNIRVKLADPALRVRKPPFIPAMAMAMTGPAVTLKTGAGKSFPAVTGFGLDRILGRQDDDIELSAAKPEYTDMLTFDAKAGVEDELFLTLWPNWKESRPDNTTVDAPLEGEFRFRLPRSMWAK